MVLSLDKQRKYGDHREDFLEFKDNTNLLFMPMFTNIVNPCIIYCRKIRKHNSEYTPMETIGEDVFHICGKVIREIMEL